jgi:hypothetical protein
MSTNLGFDCRIVADATVTFDRHLHEQTFAADLVHEVSLASLSEEFAEIVTTKTLLANVT